MVDDDNLVDDDLVDNVYFNKSITKVLGFQIGRYFYDDRLSISDWILSIIVVCYTFCFKYSNPIGDIPIVNIIAASNNLLDVINKCIRSYWYKWGY